VARDISITPQSFDDLYDVDTHRTRRDASTAADTTRPSVLRREATLFVIESELDTIGAGLAEVLTAGNQRMTWKET
jgi:hypothetical protein